MFNYNPSGTSSFSPSWGDSTAYNPSSSVLKSAGGGGMVFPIGAALGAGASIFSGIMGGMAQDRQNKNLFEIAKMQSQAEERAGFRNLLAGQYAMTGGQQFAQGLQRDAADYQQAFLDPRKSILNAENIGRTYAGELNPFAQKLRQQESSGEVNKLLAGKFMPMFESANRPFSYGRAPGYTTGSLV
jgi:hypothetical protein